MEIIDKRLQGHKDCPLDPTFEQAKNFFKFEIDETRGWNATKVGESCWKIVGIEINTGILVYRPYVTSSAGAPIDPPVVMYRHYPGAPQLDHTPNPPYYTSGNAAWTEKGGDKVGRCEFDTHVMVNDIGPDSIWVSASPNGTPPQHSDMMWNLGWNGSTNHDAVSPIFQWVTKGGSDPTPTNGAFLIYINEQNQITKYMVWLDGPPPNDGIAKLGLMVDGETLFYIPWISGNPVN